MDMKVKGGTEAAVEELPDIKLTKECVMYCLYEVAVLLSILTSTCQKL